MLPTVDMYMAIYMCGYQENQEAQTFKKSHTYKETQELLFLINKI